MYKFNVNSEEISGFLMKLRDKLVDLENSTFDFFVPLGSSGNFCGNKFQFFISLFYSSLKRFLKYIFFIL